MTDRTVTDSGNSHSNNGQELCLIWIGYIWPMPEHLISISIRTDSNSGDLDQEGETDTDNLLLWVTCVKESAKLVFSDIRN